MPERSREGQPTRPFVRRLLEVPSGSGGLRIRVSRESYKLPTTRLRGPLSLPRVARCSPKWPGNLRELAVENRTNSASIFDLSPSEKLQLVEDLWDDLAAVPEAVPVHDWQKRELARRKANLLKNPASGLPWEEVKRKVRARYAR